jgi:hypothetical protein
MLITAMQSTIKMSETSMVHKSVKPIPGDQSSQLILIFNTSQLSALSLKSEPLTHPHNLESNHVPSLQNFIDDVNAGLARSTGPNKCPYESVWVLFIRWEDDDLKVPGENNGIQGEIDALESVFVTDYGFNTEIFLIPSIDSQRALQKAIFHFQEDHNKRSDLLLVYYGGHGSLDRFERSIWMQ